MNYLKKHSTQNDTRRWVCEGSGLEAKLIRTLQKPQLVIEGYCPRCKMWVDTVEIRR